MSRSPGRRAPGSPPSGRRRQGLAVALSVLSLAGAAPALIPVPARAAAAAREQGDPFTRGMELFKDGKLAEAAVAFREAEAKDPQDPVTQSWIGFVLFKQ